MNRKKKKQEALSGEAEIMTDQTGKTDTDSQCISTAQEYLDALGEQIENSHARAAIRKEIGNHIEEQTEDYLKDGMTPQAAAAEAVRQMGDPVRTGQELNRIHRPQFPVLLFGITAALTVFGIFMQSLLFPEVAGEEWTADYLRNTLLYNAIGIAVILFLLYGNYMKLVKWVYVLLGCFVAAGFLEGMLRGGTIILASRNLLDHVGYQATYRNLYFLWILYPVLYTCLLYRLRDWGWKLILLLHGMTLAVICLLGIYTNCAPGMLESMILTTAILFLAVGRGILKGSKKVLYGLASLPVFAGILFGVSLCLKTVVGVGSYRDDYLIARMQSFFAALTGKATTGVDYIRSTLLTDLHAFSIFGGNGAAMPDVLAHDSLTVYMIHSIFRYLGIAVGVVVVLALVVFACYALHISLRQSNRAALLLGSVCSMSILLRIAVDMLVNFGFGIYYTVSIPFLAYGLGNCLVNSVMVGIILCVFRNSNVMMEEMEGKTFERTESN